MPRTAILYIEERCNQSCVFCLEADGGWTKFIAPDTAKVCSTIDQLRAQGADQITFMGGETFFRKDLPAILRHARQTGFGRLGVTTNGTVLSSPGFVQRLASAGLDMIELSIHGHTPELAQAISRSAITFPRQAKAMAEINAAGRLMVIVNVVVCAENAGALKDIAGYVLGAMPDVEVRFKFKFVSLQGGAQEQADAAPALRYEAVDFVGLGDFLEARQARFWFYNVPLCRLGRHAGHSLELGEHSWDEQFFDRDHRHTGEYYDSGYQLEGRVWPKASCGGCSARALCPGLEETYRRACGDGGLSPLSLDPVPLVAAAMADVGLDPAGAAAEWARLQRHPRPSTFVRPRPDGAVRFVHPELEPVLDVVVAERAEGQRHFFATERFALSYRCDDDALFPRATALLDAACRELAAVDARRGTLDEARRAVAACAAGGWAVAPPAPRRPRPPAPWDEAASPGTA